MAKASVLEPHYEFIMDEIARGRTYTEIADFLTAMGYKTCRNNLIKWLDRRVRRIERRMVKSSVSFLQVNVPQNNIASPDVPSPSTVSSAAISPIPPAKSLPSQAEAMAILATLIAKTEQESPFGRVFTCKK